MPALASTPFPDANKVAQSLLSPIAPTVLRIPNDFDPPLIVVKRIGGQPDVEDLTDYPIVLVAVYGEDYLAAQDLMSQVQVKILTSPLTAVSIYDTDNNITGQVLIDSAGIHVGEAELPDVFPDDRRITSTYQFGWRRPFHPLG